LTSVTNAAAAKEAKRVEACIVVQRSNRAERVDIFRYAKNTESEKKEGSGSEWKGWARFDKRPLRNREKEVGGRKGRV